MTISCVKRGTINVDDMVDIVGVRWKYFKIFLTKVTLKFFYMTFQYFSSDFFLFDVVKNRALDYRL